MFFAAWWNALSLASQIFFCIAAPATLILLIQTVMMLIGFGEDMGSDGEIELDADVDVDVDLDGDIDDIADAHALGDDADPSGLEGLRIFTVRGLIAFFVVFGWLGMALDSSGVLLGITVSVATLAGFAMMLLLAYLFRSVMKLRSDGNLDNRNAIGTAGKVHLTVPPARTGAGKVHLLLQGSFVERNAVTDEADAIPTGSEVVVVGVSGGADLVVRRK